MNSNSKLLFTFFSALCILHNIPILGYYFSGSIFPIITIITYITAFNAIGSDLATNLKKTLGLTLLPILYSILYCASIHRYSLPISIYMYLQDAIYPIIGLYLIKSNDVKMAKRLLVVILIAYVITCITTSYGCYLNPTAARALTGQQEDTALYGMLKMQNIGDFHFVYFLVFSLPLIICALRFKAINKCLILLLIVLVLLTIYLSAYTTALLLAAISFVLFITPKEITSKKIVTLFSFLIILALLSTSFLSGILGSIASTVGSEDVAQRLGDMSNYMVSGEMADEGNDMSIRISLWQGSLVEFFNSPIWGTWGGVNIGGHSYFFDTLGHFGIIGLIVYFYTFLNVFKTFFKPFKDEVFGGYLTVVFVLVIIQTILNPTPSLLTTTLLVPIFTVLFSKFYNSQKLI